MKIIKQKVSAIIGAISASVGVAGAAIAELGLCTCIWAPIFSITGILSFALGFLSRYRTYFFAAGIAFMLISIVMYKKRGTCKIHRKIKK